MNIAPAPAAYDKTDQDRMRGAVTKADGQNIKLGQVLDEILMRDTDTGEIVTLTVASGVLVIT